MNKTFLQNIFNRQLQKQTVPDNANIANWAAQLIGILFPELSYSSYGSVTEVEAALNKLKFGLYNILEATSPCCHNDLQPIATHFFHDLPALHKLLCTDIAAFVNGDPAATSEFEVIRSYPGFYALCYYRIAHSLLKLAVPLLPRILTEHAHSHTGIDIHPGAEIDEHFFIDHGTGVVIGETAIIGKRVKIYQGVTLGALSVNKNMVNTKRHPTVQDDVVIYSGATILGGNTLIGARSIIGGNVWLTHSVEPDSLVSYKSGISIVKRIPEKELVKS